MYTLYVIKNIQLSKYRKINNTKIAKTLVKNSKSRQGKKISLSGIKL